MRATTKGWGGSYHRINIETSPAALIALAERLGAEYEINNDGTDKTNFDFLFETEDGDQFTVYDWKEYRPLELTEIVEFHIGASNRSIAQIAHNELILELYED